MQCEAKSFLNLIELISFLKEIWPGARCVQVGKMESHICFFYDV